MGDRANIRMMEGQDRGVHLYTHWAGTELPATLQRALARRLRWDDHAYLARIVFDAMTEGETGSETGHGISIEPCDGQDRVLEVDADKRLVRVKNGETGFIYRVFTFDEFVSLDESLLSWESLRGEPTGA